jgi:hypothetical protein
MRHVWRLMVANAAFTRPIRWILHSTRMPSGLELADDTHASHADPRLFFYSEWRGSRKQLCGFRLIGAP